ncbi:DUF4124 domain-containing protein [Massilia sp. TN1-12]|uniref:DUF4124 domain-containing protein n=1 Tax=Massilia paldalensis TaxID=3377675 RepID=UPI00384CC9F4
MKRALSLAGWLAAALPALAISVTASLAPLAPAQAGDVVKCVDGSGHATFTDQPCPAGSTGRLLATDGSAAQGGSGLTASTGSSDPEPSAPPVAAMTPTAPPQRHVLPAADLRHDAWRRPAGAVPAPLARDVATLKAARRMLLQQEGTRASLAGIQ